MTISARRLSVVFCWRFYLEVNFVGYIFRWMVTDRLVLCAWPNVDGLHNRKGRYWSSTIASQRVTPRLKPWNVRMRFFPRWASQLSHATKGNFNEFFGNVNAKNALHRRIVYNSRVTLFTVRLIGENFFSP